jgi:hypothetical protein
LPLSTGNMVAANCVRARPWLLHTSQMLSLLAARAEACRMLTSV